MNFSDFDLIYLIKLIKRTQIKHILHMGKYRKGLQQH